MLDALTTESAPSTTSTRLMRLADALEWPLGFLALLIVPALVLEEKASDPHFRGAAYITKWILWLAFVAAFAIRLGSELVRPHYYLCWSSQRGLLSSLPNISRLLPLAFT